MAFPDDYEENQRPCLRKKWPHKWITAGHPLKHSCQYCHQARWIEKRAEVSERTLNPANAYLERF